VQAEVSLTALPSENGCINPFSVVPQTQPELLVVIADFDLDTLCLGVPKGVPQRLGCKLVNFVTHDRVQISRFTPNRDMECWPMAGWAGFDLFSERAYGQREIVPLHCGIAQSLHRITAFGDRGSGLLYGTVQLRLRIRMFWQQFGNGL
jgi:hypothetical protein